MKKIILLNLIFLLSFLSRSSAQEHVAVEPVFISFGEKVNEYKDEVSINDTWRIAEEDGRIVASGTGATFTDFVFSTPGNYKLHIDTKATHAVTEGDGCGHHAPPDVTIIRVSPVSMQFDFSGISFSRPLSTGNAAEDIVIDVPVHVKVFGASENYRYQPQPAKTAGVSATLVAHPTESNIALKTGTIHLKYRVSGTISEPSYIMFDFVDYNGMIQSYPYPGKIQ